MLQLGKISLRSLFELTTVIAICFSFASSVGPMGSACLSLMAVCLRLQLGIPTVVCCAAGMLLADDGAGGLIYIAVALAVASWPLVSMKLWPSTYTAGFNADSTQTRC